jgi:hypothetical protein
LPKLAAAMPIQPVTPATPKVVKEYNDHRTYTFTVNNNIDEQRLMKMIDNAVRARVKDF